MKAQVDSTFWYVNGVPDWWYNQPDVFAFRCVNGLDYIGSYDTSVVSLKVYRSDRRDEAVEIYFKPTATPSQRLQEIMNFYNSGQIEVPYPVVTKNPFGVYSEKRWKLIDDLILVKFSDPDADSLDIVSFMNNYGLGLVDAPSSSLPAMGHYYYTFQIPPLSKEDFISLARRIIEEDTGFVAEAIPNIVNFTVGDDYLLDSLINPIFTPSPGGTSPLSLDCQNVDDPYYINNANSTQPDKFATWHIDNANGFTPISLSASPTATPDADADICECWDLGLTGDGIKIAFVGEGKWNINGLDLDINKMTPGFDCSTGNCIPLASLLPDNVGSYGLTDMITVAASIGNNQYGTVGVAPNIEWMPMKTALYTGQTSLAALKAAFDKLLDDYNVDIIVTNVLTDINYPLIQGLIDIHLQAGRFGKGTIIIAPSGGTGAFQSNPFANPPITFPVYPAADNGVIGVIPSTPEDKRKAIGDGWNTQSSQGDEEANYQPIGPQYYDIAAPGVYVMANGVHPSGQSYYLHYGSQTENIAPAVTGGVVALLLEQNNNQADYTQVINALQIGAEKVHSGTLYNYINGFSNEMGYGRLSCINSPINAATGIETKPESSYTPFKVSTEGAAIRIRRMDGSNSGLKITLTNLVGQAVLEENWAENRSEILIQGGNIPQGIYLLSVLNDYNEIVYSTKLFIQL